MTEIVIMSSSDNLTVYNVEGGPMDAAANMTEAAESVAGYRYWTVLLGLFVLLTLFGNILVIMAVVKVRSLQNITNYLILSLAVADIFVGALVMPLAVYVEVMGGQFPLHVKVCDAWVSLDVLACTASILMMTAISIDRYLAICSAILYTNKLKHSTWYPVLMISLCWIISLAVALPILFGANNTEHRVENVCFFFNPLFSTMSSMASFFIPTTVMVILYWKIFRVIRQRASATKAKCDKKFQALNLKRESSSDNSGQSEEPLANNQSLGTQSAGTQSPGRSVISETTDNHLSLEQPLTYGSTDNNNKADHELYSAENGSLLHCGNGDNYDTAHENQVSVKQVTIMDKNMDYTSNGKSAKPYQNQKKLSILQSVHQHFSPTRKTSAMRKKDKREKRERKATITLVVVLCVFLVCWIPFFLANNLSAICQHWTLSLSICNIPDALMSFIVWLGYINSMLNPMIYAALNVEYRKAFKKLLHCA